MEFGVLGPLQVRDGDAVVDVRRGISRVILLALVVRVGETVAPSWLAEVIWADEQPSNPPNALQTQVSYLRRALASGPSRLQPIATRAGGYVLDVSPESVDGARFLRTVERARRQAELGTGEALTGALDALDGALALWRGPAFDDAAGRLFAIGEATRLEDARVSAIELRVDCLLALGRHQEASAELGPVLSVHPLRERLYEQLMLAQYRAGRQADALRTYGVARATLRDELGLDPGPSLQQLERSVLAHAPELDWVPPLGVEARAARITMATVDRDRRSTVPAAVTRLIGRDHELEKVSELLARGRLVTLTGPGGSGKTSIAAEIARAAAAERSVTFVDLAPVTVDELVPQAVATVLGAPTQPGQDPVEALTAAFGDGEELVVLDTCEHVIAGAARVVSGLLSACPGVRVLATSRRPLGVRGELASPVPPLALPPAVTLFVERATAVRPDFALTDRNADDVAAICSALDGLPLAIELAAARADILSPGAIRDRLCDRFALLVDGDRDASQRQQTLRATIDWSVALLSPDERKLFVRLSVFTGPFGLDEAVAVAGLDLADPVGALAGLVRQSMVAATGDDHYQLLDTPREYGRELLAEDPDRDAVFERHARSYVDLVATAADGLWSPRQPEFVGVLRGALPNVRAAVAWCFEHGQEELAARIVASLSWFFMLDGMIAEGLDLLRRADAAGANLSRYAKSRIAYGIGVLSSPLGRLDEARAACERSVRLARHGGDRRSTADALAALSVAEWAAGSFADAAAHQDEAIHLYEASGDPWRTADILVLRARTAVDQGDPAARQRLSEAVDYARSVGDHHAAGMALAQRSLVALVDGDPDAAVADAREALAAHEALGEPEATAAALHLLGQATRALGRLDEARGLHRRALDLASGIGHVGAICEAVEDLAAVAADEGRPEAAARLLAAAERERAAQGIPQRALERPRVDALRATLPEPIGAVSIDAVVEELRST